MNTIQPVINFFHEKWETLLVNVLSLVLGAIISWFLWQYKEKLMVKKKKKELIENALSEAEFNRKQIKRWLKMIQGYRDFIGEIRNTVPEYLSVSQRSELHISKILESGFLFKSFTPEQISGYSNFIKWTSPEYEAHLNQIISPSMMEIPLDNNKKRKLVQTLDMYEKQLQLHEDVLSDFCSILRLELTEV